MNGHQTIVIPFPVTQAMQDRHARIASEKFISKIDAEIREIHAEVDEAILGQYGSYYGYGLHILKTGHFFSPQEYSGIA